MLNGLVKFGSKAGMRILETLRDFEQISKSPCEGDNLHYFLDFRYSSICRW